MVRKSQQKATSKYEKDNYFKTQVRFKKSDEQRIRAAVGDGSLNGFIVKCVLDRLDSTEPDQPEPVAAPEPKKPVKKNDITVAEAFKILQDRGSGIKAQRERSELAKEARKEFDREETLRRDKDRKTDIPDASRAVYSPEKKEPATSDDPELDRITENMNRILAGEPES